MPVNGFRHETEVLNPEEIKCAHIIAAGLEQMIGVKNAVTNKKMVAALEKRGYKVASSRIRAIIHYIRVHRLVTYLVANSNGYYRELNEDERKKYVQSLEQRINSIREIQRSFTI
jgi:spore coat protein CotF